MSIEKRIIELLKTGKATIQTNKLVLFAWYDDCFEEDVFEVVKNVDENDEIASIESMESPIYQGTSFSGALKFLENVIK